MAVNPSAFGPKPQLELSTGLPAVGGQLFFYVAGSSATKQNSYTSSTGLVANTNPLVLNALGEPSTEIWWTAGQSYKVVYAPAGDTDPPTSPIWTIDNLRGINDSSVTIDQWVAGPAPTFISTTQFSLAGDQTSTFQVGRRVKTTNTGGTIYSSISASSFGAGITTVTVINDSGTLDSGLSAVSYGILSGTNQSVPNVLVTSQIKFPATQNASSDPNTLDDYVEGSFTITHTGMTTVVTVTATYTKIGNAVILCIPATTGTSNNITHTFTGIPAAIQTATAKRGFVSVTDNGTLGGGIYRLNAGAGTIDLGVGLTSANFTNSGTAGTLDFQIAYTLA